MIKGAGTFLAAAALLSAATVPALAIFETNATVIGIKNMSQSVSSSGLNSQSSMAALVDSDHTGVSVGSGDRHMTTGPATANATATVNTSSQNNASVYGVDMEGTLEVDNGTDWEVWFNLDNLTFADCNVTEYGVENGASAAAFTGENMQDEVVLGDDVDHSSLNIGSGVRTLNTGAAASSANAAVTINAVNVGQFGL